MGRHETVIFAPRVLTRVFTHSWHVHKNHASSAAHNSYPAWQAGVLPYIEGSVIYGNECRRQCRNKVRSVGNQLRFHNTRRVVLRRSRSHRFLERRRGRTSDSGSREDLDRVDVELSPAGSGPAGRLLRARWLLLFVSLDVRKYVEAPQRDHSQLFTLIVFSERNLLQDLSRRASW
jgi:hypothetical protein